MDNISVRHYAVVNFRNLLSDDEEKFLALALNMEIIPLKKDKNSYMYTFEASSKEQLKKFLAILRKSYIFSVEQFSK